MYDCIASFGKVRLGRPSPGRPKRTLPKEAVPILSIPDDATSFEQEMEKRAECAAQVSASNQLICPFPVQSLLRHPIHGTSFDGTVRGPIF